MNFICSIFLTLFVVFRPLVPLVEYAVNYEYISQVLCINKNNPDLHCNGKCYVSKEIAKTHDTDPSPVNKTKNPGQKLLDVYVLPDNTEIQVTEKSFLADFKFTYKTDYSFLFLKNIFRPPVF
ncbi:hypothetical protein ODZ84_15980 [Chryseobacterium fluminis]|uniref:hypothetical protein n=1 Tax=Chryseobacterium fluminis TaxID=2983606 RepID=UPI0022508739|nr:hypothetical protein [Chryseobacterium sp. MMS21-Ot14]UZT96712.1 hypothetical protein ODZ84_15980 [Chryseobacterium sp. MMS21-Ot14]